MWYILLVRKPGKPPEILFQRCQAAIFGRHEQALLAAEQVYEDAQAVGAELAVVTSEALFGVDLDRDAAFADDIGQCWAAVTPFRRPLPLSREENVP